MSLGKRSGGFRDLAPTRARGTLGFTLIEVLVALTILSLALGVIYSLFSTSMRARQTAQDYEQATQLAESRLESVGVSEPIREGETQGRFDERFAWRIVVRPYRETGRDESRDIARRPMTVTVTVFWGDGSDRRSVTLSTLRLVPRY